MEGGHPALPGEAFREAEALSRVLSPWTRELGLLTGVIIGEGDKV